MKSVSRLPCKTVSYNIFNYFTQFILNLVAVVLVYNQGMYNRPFQYVLTVDTVHGYHSICNILDLKPKEF